MFLIYPIQVRLNRLQFSINDLFNFQCIIEIISVPEKFKMKISPLLQNIDYIAAAACKVSASGCGGFFFVLLKSGLFCEGNKPTFAETKPN